MKLCSLLKQTLAEVCTASLCEFAVGRSSGQHVHRFGDVIPLNVIYIIMEIMQFKYHSGSHQTAPGKFVFLKDPKPKSRAEFGYMPLFCSVNTL